MTDTPAHTPLPWEGVESEVTAAIKKATQPLLLKAADDFYGALLDATQDYLCENITYNIAARISVAERQAQSDRQELAREREKTEALIEALRLWIAYDQDADPESVDFMLAYDRALTATRAALSQAGGHNAD